MTTSDKPFISSATTNPSFLATDEFQKELTVFIKLNYSMFRFRKVIISMSLKESDMAAELLIKEACDNVYATHNYLYTGLWNSMNFEYDPITNYDSVEHEEIQNRGTDSSVNDASGYVDTDSFHADAYTDKENLGVAKSTTDMGSRHVERDGENKVAPFESQDYNNLNNSFASETHDAVQDVTTVDAVENTHTIGERQERNELEHGRQTVSNDFTHGHDITRDFTRKGNIGIMTTQQMIEQERRVVRMNLIRIIANDLIQTLCTTFLY